MNRMTTMMRHMEPHILRYLANTNEATQSDIGIHLWEIGKHLEKPSVSVVLRHMVADAKVVREMKLTTGGAGGCVGCENGLNDKRIPYI